MRPIVLALCLTVGGCGLVQQAQNARLLADAKTAMQICRENYPAVVGDMLARADCMSNASRSIPSAAVGLINAERRGLYEKADRGEISVSDAQSQIARLVYELSEREKEQNASARAAHEASQAAAAPAWAGLAAAGLGTATQRSVPAVTTCNFYNRSATCVGN